MWCLEIAKEDGGLADSVATVVLPLHVQVTFEV